MANQKTRLRKICKSPPRPQPTSRRCIGAHAPPAKTKPMGWTVILRPHRALHEQCDRNVDFPRLERMSLTQHRQSRQYIPCTCAALPQLDRGSDYESERHRFESCTPHHLRLKASSFGSWLFSFPPRAQAHCQLALPHFWPACPYPAKHGDGAFLEMAPHAHIGRSS